MTKKGSKKAAKNENTATPAAAAAETKPKPAKGKKQGELSGFERKKIDEIDKAAEVYRKARNTRQAQTKVEKAKKQELMAIARKHGVKVYIYESDDGEELQLEYTAETKENVKVSKIDVDEDED